MSTSRKASRPSASDSRIGTLVKALAAVRVSQRALRAELNRVEVEACVKADHLRTCLKYANGEVAKWRGRAFRGEKLVESLQRDVARLAVIVEELMTPEPALGRLAVAAQSREEFDQLINKANSVWQVELQNAMDREEWVAPMKGRKMSKTAMRNAERVAAAVRCSQEAGPQ